MADNYLNTTGLNYYHQKISALFASQDDLDTLSGRVDDIVSEGGEPNVINIVKKNGTTLPVDSTDKSVNVTVPTTVAELTDASSYALVSSVPTSTSDLTNDGDGTSNFATEAYVATNGGKIDKIKVNGAEQTITNKEVDIAVPTKTSDLTNDGNGTSNFATEDYVSTYGGKIDKIKVNGTEQTITNKEVDIAVPTTVAELTDASDYALAANIPTAVSDLTNDSNFQTDTEVQAAISTAVASAYKYKGSVANQAALPASAETGDVYDVQDSGMNYAWNGTAWDALGQYVDTSVLWTSTSGQTNSLIAITTAEIDTIVAE